MSPDKHFHSEAQAETFDSSMNRCSETLSACARELEVFASGTATGLTSTFQNRWHCDKNAVMGEIAGAGLFGIAAGIASRNYPELVNGLGALGAIAFTATEYPNIQSACGTFGKAWRTTWNNSDNKSLNRARAQIAEGWHSPLFDLALVGGVGAVTAGVTPFAAERAAFHLNDNLHPAAGSDYASNYPGKILDRLPFYVLRKGSISEDEIVAQHVPLSMPGQLGIHPDPIIGLEKVRQPTEDWLGMEEYITRPEKPPVRGFPTNKRALQYLYEDQPSSLKPEA